MEAKNKNSKKVRLVGSIVEDVLQGWNRSTELCCDVKTILHSDRTLKTGKDYQGVLRRDHGADIDEFRCRVHHHYASSRRHAQAELPPAASEYERRALRLRCVP